MWLEAAGRADMLEKNYQNYKLSEDHFERKYIFTTLRGKRLYNDAVPSIINKPKRPNSNIQAPLRM